MSVSDAIVAAHRSGSAMALADRIVRDVDALDVILDPIVGDELDGDLMAVRQGIDAIRGRLQRVLMDEVGASQRQQKPRKPNRFKEGRR